MRVAGIECARMFDWKQTTVKNLEAIAGIINSIFSGGTVGYVRTDQKRQRAVFQAGRQKK